MKEQDTESQKAVEEDLVETHSLDMLEDLPQALFLVDPTGTVIWMNDACVETSGRSRAEALGKMKCYDLYDVDADETPIEYCLRTGEKVRDEQYTITSDDGERTVIEASVTLVHDDDGDIAGAFEMVRDVTEKVQLEEEVAEREEYYSSIFESINQPLFVADPDLTIIWMNDACAELTGYSRDEVEDEMKCRDVFNSDICNTNCALQQCFRTREAIDGARVEMTNRSGTDIPLLAGAGAIENSDGELIGGFELVRDITEQIEVERNIREMADELASASEQQAATAEEVAASGEEVAASVQQVASASERQLEAAQEAKEAIASVAPVTEQISNTSTDVAKDLGTLVETSDEVQDISKSVREVSDAVEDALREMASAAQEVTGVVENVGDAAGEVGEQANDVAQESQKGLNQADEVAEVMEKVQEVVMTSQSQLQELTEMSEQVNRIAGNIEDIADQTNLLALNAAIEAARAGEAGRGFAVVAEEVRGLAEQARTNAQEAGQVLGDVDELITSMEDPMEQSVEGTDEALESTERVQKGLEEIASSAQDVGSASEEVAASSQQVVSASQEVADSGHSNAEEAEKVVGHADDVAETADTVKNVGVENRERTDEMVDAIEKANEGVSATEERNEEVMELAEKNSSAIQEISAAIQEQASSMQQISSGAQQVAGIVQQLNATADSLGMDDAGSDEASDTGDQSKAA